MTSPEDSSSARKLRSQRDRYIVYDGSKPVKPETMAGERNYLPVMIGSVATLALLAGGLAEYNPFTKRKPSNVGGTPN